MGEVMQLIRTVCEDRNMKATISGSVGVAIGGAVGGFVGALAAGPFGGVPGAAIGAGIAAAVGDDFKPLWQVISEWPQESKDRLANSVREILGRTNYDPAALMGVAGGAAAAVREQVVDAVVNFCQNHMNVNVRR